MPAGGAMSTVSFADPPDRLQRMLAQTGGRWWQDRGRLVFSIDPGRMTVPELVNAITAAYTVRDMFIETPPIEEVVARIYAESGPAAGA